MTDVSFRLLAEYHSFLFGRQYNFNKEFKRGVSFRLLAEYHSFL